MTETIEKLIRVAPVFPVTENGGAIHNYFEENKEAEGVVIVDGEKPVGILMRQEFYQKIGRQFGYALYMKRNVTLVMKTDITCVDKGCDMAKFGFITMSRDQDSIYDFVVILEDGKYAGIVSIREFLIEMSNAKEREIEAEKLHSIEIEQKNAAIKNLLDHAGQGFLFFGVNMLISEEYSKECDGIFGFSIGGRNILEVIKGSLDERTVDTMRDAFENVFREQNKTRNKVYLSLLPEEIKIGERYIQTEYKVIPSQSEKSVMMILTDITEKKALELKNAEEKNNIKLIIRAISSKSEVSQAVEDLHEFVEREALQLLDGSYDPQTVVSHIFREIHTMKGDFSLNSLHHTSAGLHRLEDALSRMKANIESVTMEGIREFLGQIDCDRLLEQDISVIIEALGTHYFEKDDIYTVSRQRITEIEDKIAAAFPEDEQAEIFRLLHSLFHTNVKDIMKDYNDYIKTLAERFGKNISEIKITGEDVYVNRDRYFPFIKSLVHVFRNMADHGIEDPDERVNSGKPECGEISCELEKYEDKFILCLADDGKGIDPDVIRKKAVEKGIYSEDEVSRLSRERILETIFLDDFSTRDTVDLYSGRGVGMAAVNSETEEIGGEIIVDSETGKYTRFKFILPLYQQ
ncbi:MAG TPA: ATP-binding protein [Anaerovoracaceae bacterium]|nr:ATP-binding protein [Anaerovoracaceae bacterium]